jgi:uroporphyrinogen III methyltransferase/synthase
MANSEPLVYLVGAGPGSPDLLTLRAQVCLARADLVLYDRLVSRQVLQWAAEGAHCRCVTDLAPRHAERGRPVIAAMIEAARQGKTVVRLKGGDPLVFGRGGEEAEALRQAGIPYEIVPGVTAALGAAAYAGIPLTHRSLASAVALVAGHEIPDKGDSALDWGALSAFPGTLVIYMGVGRLAHITSQLITYGKDPNCPAAAVQLATTGRQRTVEAPLFRLAHEVALAEMASPAVVIIGPVVGLRPRLSWCERRPLFGRRVLVTRPPQQAAEFAARLEELGAVPLSMPLVEIREPADWRPVDRALENLRDYQWLVFSSASGVRAFLGRLRRRGLDLRTLGHLQLAAIGPGTALALRVHGLDADVIPVQFRSESLAKALKEKAAGQRLLLARADRGRDVLRQELASVAAVDQVAVYSQVDADVSKSEALSRLQKGDVDFITLTSSNIARALIRILNSDDRARIKAGSVKLVSISPVTSEVVRAGGLPVAAEATTFTMAGVVDALVLLNQSDAIGGRGERYN